MMSDPSSPRAQRDSVMLSARVHRPDRTVASAHRVLNLSATGLGLSPADGLDVGMVVTVSVGQIALAVADVVRVANDRAGVRFRQPVDPAAARSRRIGDEPSPPTGGWLAEMQNVHR